MADDPGELGAEEVRPDLWRLPIPTPFPGRPVNAYLLPGEEPTLVDTGPRTTDARSALEAHLADRGLEPADLARVVLTHEHVDHFGLLPDLLEAGDPEVVCHELAVRGIRAFEVTSPRRIAKYRRLLADWGWPDEGLDAVRSYLEWVETLGAPAPDLEPVILRGTEGTLPVGGRDLRWIHAPGHARGLVVLDLEAEGLLLSSDQVLPDLTPNPTAHAPPVDGRRSGLPDYVRSIRALRSLGERSVAPGHGPVFEGLRARLDAILAHHEERTAELREALADGPATCRELAVTLFDPPDAAGLFLASRETFGHLEMEREAGRVRAASSDRGTRWTLAEGDDAP